MSRPKPPFALTAEILLRAYSIGLFPMAESAEDPTLFWVDPKQRGIFPLDGLKISRSLAKLVRSEFFEIRVDDNFDAIISACADREKTWINAEIKELYGQLYERGNAHCVSVWREGALVGGLYGVSLGAAFFGESMFHRARDASKLALVHLVARLRYGGFTLLDTQFVTPHLAGLGALEIERADYLERLRMALASSGNFAAWSKARPMSGAHALALCRGEAFRGVR